MLNVLVHIFKVNKDARTTSPYHRLFVQSLAVERSEQCLESVQSLQ